jgi:hypothetical protein
MRIRTQFITQNVNPVWKEMRIKMSELCNGSNKSPFVIECWDMDKAGAEDASGKVPVRGADHLGRNRTTVAQILKVLYY